MKIIISHDVDHLHWSDNLTDLFYPKLWVRETLAFLRHRINTCEWALRMTIPFHRNLNHLDELMRFDKEHGIPSTFFFGMAKGLGMSYSRKKALTAIRMVQAQNFSTGVHGIAFDDYTTMRREFERYIALTGDAPSGIRMHYVRFCDNTFKMLNKIGYAYDTTEFCKRKGYCIKAPYKIGNMWEFPLTIMDAYLPYNEQEAKLKTIEILDKACDQKVGYCTILFHDINYSNAFLVYKDWYRWLIGYCRSRNMQFVGFDTAIQELEANNF